MSGAVILGVVYGLDVRGIDDPHLEVVEKGVQIAVAASNAGAFLGIVQPPCIVTDIR